jgi:hypothetical protein
MRVHLKTDRLAQLLADSSLSQNHWAMKLGLPAATGRRS